MQVQFNSPIQSLNFRNKKNSPKKVKQSEIQESQTPPQNVSQRQSVENSGKIQPKRASKNPHLEYALNLLGSEKLPGARSSILKANLDDEAGYASNKGGEEGRSASRTSGLFKSAVLGFTQPGSGISIKKEKPLMKKQEQKKVGSYDEKQLKMEADLDSQEDMGSDPEPEFLGRQQVYINLDREVVSEFAVEQGTKTLDGRVSGNSPLRAESYKNQYLNMQAPDQDTKEEQIDISTLNIDPDSQLKNLINSALLSRGTDKITYGGRESTLNKQTISSQLKASMRGESVQSGTGLTGRRKSNNGTQMPAGIEFDAKNYESTPTEDKNNYNKINMKAKNQTKTSPKRGVRMAKESKQPLTSAERKERYRDVNRTETKKGSTSVSTNVFHTLYSLKKNDAIHSSSLNNFQPVRKQEFQTAVKNSGASKGPSIEANRTPAKFKKQTFLNSQKKSTQNANLSSLKVLSQSLTASKAGNVLVNSLQQKVGSIETPNEANTRGTGSGQVRRIGIHQGSTDLSSGANEQYQPVESRQMVNSPNKQRPVGRNKDDQTIFTGKKTISSLIDSKMVKGAPKIDARGGKDDAGSRLFTSKSPSKKTVHLQQILKSIGQQESQVLKKPVNRKAPEYMNQNTKSSSLVRNFVNNAIGGSHTHTKSFQALLSGKASTIVPSALDYRFSVGAPAGESTKAGAVNNSMISLEHSVSVLNKHQNPYIHKKNKPSAAALDRGGTGTLGFQSTGDKPQQASAPEKAVMRSGSGILDDETPVGEERAADDLVVKPGKRTQTSLNSRDNVKSSMSANLQIKVKLGMATGSKVKQGTRNSKATHTQGQMKALNSPTSVRSLKVHSLLTDRSERSALTRKQDRLQALLHEKRQTLGASEQKGMLSERRNPVLSEREIRQPLKKASRTSHSKDVAFGYRDKEKYANKYLLVEKGEQAPKFGAKGPIGAKLKQNRDAKNSSAFKGREEQEPEVFDKVNVNQIDLSGQEGDAPAAEKSGVKETRYIEISFSNENNRAQEESSDLRRQVEAGPPQREEEDEGRDSPELEILDVQGPTQMQKYSESESKTSLAKGARSSNRRRKNKRKEDSQFDSRAKDSSLVSLTGNRNPPTGSAIKEAGVGNGGGEENISMIQHSEEYSFARNPNGQNQEGSRVPDNEVDVKSDQEMLPPDINNFFGPMHSDSLVEPELEVISFPMSVSQFLENFKYLMLREEIQELEEGSFETIYYGGLITQRNEDDIAYLRHTMNDRISTFNQKKMETQDSNNGEFQGNPLFDNYEGYYRVQIRDHLDYRYEIIRILGKGSFAQVVECKDHMQPDKPIFAVKITRNTEMDHKFAHKEAQYLTYIMQEDPQDKHNIVRMLDQCYFRDHQCFVFELLHTDLFEHLKATGFVGFSTDKIRDYAVQLLKGLVFLEKHKIIHCDLKPENILCADTMCRNLKIVDFGSGCFRDEQIYTYVQSRFYRSPEVILRIKYTEKVDIWSVGCILAELYTGEPLFPGNNEQEQLELIMELCGMPPNSMVDRSRKKEHYFDTDYSPYLIEDEELGILRIPNARSVKEAVPCEDAEFLDFISKCLEIDPETRFSASEAIEHPWVKAALHDKLIKTKVIDQRLLEKKKPSRRMGQNESIEKLYQPQIIRDRDNREREKDGAKEIPLEFSPERDIFAQRKRTAQQPNKESFGIKINNLNPKKELSVGKQNIQSKANNQAEVKVTDFIAEQKQIGLIKMAKSEESKKRNTQVNEYTEAGHSKTKENPIISRALNAAGANDGAFGSSSNSYFNTLCRQELSKHKSIIPDIDFTNKYVRKQQPPLISTNTIGASRNINVIAGPDSQPVASSSTLPQQPFHQSPFRNKFSHLNSVENHLDPVDDLESLQAAEEEQQAQAHQSPNKKKKNNVNYFLPSQ